MIIDDEYCKKIGNYIAKQGEQIDKIIVSYISILENVRENAVKEGLTAEALSRYISQASRLKTSITLTSLSAKKQVQNFVTKINQIDKFS